ncbi:hypothetical protein GCM10028799_57160 [Kribbella italica]
MPVRGDSYQVDSRVAVGRETSRAGVFRNAASCYCPWAYLRSASEIAKPATLAGPNGKPGSCPKVWLGPERVTVRASLAHLSGHKCNNPPGAAPRLTLSEHVDER